MSMDYFGFKKLVLN